MQQVDNHFICSTVYISWHELFVVTMKHLPKHLLSERLASFGIMKVQFRIPLKSYTHHSTIELKGLRKASIEPQLCRQATVSRTSKVSLSSMDFGGKFCMSVLHALPVAVHDAQEAVHISGRYFCVRIRLVCGIFVCQKMLRIFMFVYFMRK